MAGPLAKFRKPEVKPPKVEKKKSRKPVAEKKEKPVSNLKVRHEPYEYFIFIKRPKTGWLERQVSYRKYYSAKGGTPTKEKLVVHTKVSYYFERRRLDGSLVDVPPNPPRPFTEFGKWTPPTAVAKPKAMDDIPAAEPQAGMTQ